MILYFICGFTDILDGYIARKTKTESNFGTKLDTISDLLFFIVMFIIMFDIFLKDINGENFLKNNKLKLDSVLS